MADFEVIGEITNIEQIARGHGIREIARLNRSYGETRWRKLKDEATIRLSNVGHGEQSYIGTRDTGSASSNSNANATWTNAMTHSETTDHSYVSMRGQSGYEAALEKHKIYKVLADQAAVLDHDMRVIDESGEDYLYPSARFVPIAVPDEVERSLTASGE